MAKPIQITSYATESVGGTIVVLLDDGRIYECWRGQWDLLEHGPWEEWVIDGVPVSK